MSSTTFKYHLLVSFDIQTNLNSPIVSLNGTIQRFWRTLAVFHRFSRHRRRLKKAFGGWVGITYKSLETRTHIAQVIQPFLIANHSVLSCLADYISMIAYD